MISKKQLKKNKNDEQIDIKTILDDINDEEICTKCKKPIKLEKKFLTSPQFLIIIIKQKDNIDYQIMLQENIKIKQCNLDKYNCHIKYDLISFINTNNITFCKSHLDNKWYKYDEKGIIPDIRIKEEKSIPYFLIYKKK